MTATSRRSGGSSLEPGTVVLWAVIVVVVVGVGALTGAVHLGQRLAGGGVSPPGNPFELVVGLVTGAVAWPGPASAVLAGGAALLAVIGAGVGVRLGRRGRRRSRVDRAARYSEPPWKSRRVPI